MLEAMRQNSQSAIIYILFGLLIAAFVISFGPGSFGGSSKAASEDYAALVNGNEISEQDFRFAAVIFEVGNTARDQRTREMLMDQLIDRELMAQEGERMGLLTSEEEAARMVADGRIMAAGMQRRIFPEGKFNYERFQSMAQYHYRMTIKKVMEIQQREMTAHKVQELMRAAVQVSPDEVKADFEEKGRQVNLEYVRFSPRRYHEDVTVTDAEIENWARGHEDAIKKAFEERKYLYEKQDPQVHLRRVLIEVAKDAPPEKVKDAQAKIDAAHKTITSGTKFADVARTVSEDAASRARGGDLGWKKKGFTGLGDEVEAKVFAAKEGEVIGPVRTDRGFELLRNEGQRQGDITLAQARTELAEDLLRQEKTKEMAKAQAAEAANKVKAGGKLAELFPKAETGSDTDEAKPKTGKAAKVSVEETGLFSRRGDTVQGLGSSQELARAAFKLKAGESAGPIEVGGDFVVVTVKEKKEPDMADFEKRKAELTEVYQRTKAYEVMSGWTRHRCTEIRDKGKLKVNQAYLAVEGAGKDALAMIMPKYEPCAPQRAF
jgi:peptidyl-prolyl cis-trans isomerase D